jgi:hypothetical protein
VRLLARFRSLLGLPLRVQEERLTYLSTKAHHPADELLERRIAAARAVMGTVEVKPDRKLIEEQPTTFKVPKD